MSQTLEEAALRVALVALAKRVDALEDRLEPPPQPWKRVDARRLAHLEAIEAAAQDWCVSAARSYEFHTPTSKALFRAVRGGAA